MRASIRVIQCLEIGHLIIHQIANISTISPLLYTHSRFQCALPTVLCTHVTNFWRILAPHVTPAPRFRWAKHARDRAVKGFCFDLFERTPDLPVPCVRDHGGRVFVTWGGEGGDGCGCKRGRVHVRMVGGFARQTDEKFIITLERAISVLLDNTFGGLPCPHQSPPCSALPAAQESICLLMHARLRIWGCHCVNPAGVRQTVCGVCTVVRFTF
jgi:hypothetical protein